MKFMDICKAAIQKSAFKLGYSITRISSIDLKLYAELYGPDVVREKRFYNIGAGNFRHPAWTNVDHSNDWYGEIQGDSVIDWDLLSLTPIHVGNEKAVIVYSSHTIEHIPNEAATYLFQEVHRILRRDGLIRIVTPNIDLAFRAYQNNDRHFFHWIEHYSKTDVMRRAHLATPMNKAPTGQIFLHQFAEAVSSLHPDGAKDKIDDIQLSQLFSELDYEDALDYCISRCPIEIQKKYPGNHINWWNARKLVGMLREAGFSRVYESGYGQSACPVLRDTHIFDNTHPKASLYVEAVK